MPKILIPIASGFEEIEAVTIIDILRRAGMDVIVAALTENLIVKGANNINIQCDINIDLVNPEELDMVVLPGGWGGTKALAYDERIKQILNTINSENKWIGAICAAPFALEAAGVLKEGFTCYPSVEQEIATPGFLGDKSSVVITDNIITSRGPGTAMCFALAIVKQFEGIEAYETLKGGLLADDCK